MLLHLVGVVVHAPSNPLVMVLPALPLPRVFFQPRPCSSMLAAAGSFPTYLLGSAAPWVLPKVWPPAISATVSSSFIAMRAKVSRISRAEAIGSGFPLGPSGFTYIKPICTAAKGFSKSRSPVYRLSSNHTRSAPQYTSS